MKLATRNHPLGNTSLINWFFDDILTKEAFNTAGHTHSVLSALKTPGMNVSDSKTEYNLELAVPGLDKKDIHIDIKKGALHVSAEKTQDKDSEVKNYKSREFNFSSFKRSYRIPEHVDVEKINAEYKNGILEISLPKTEVGKNGLSVKVK